MDEQHLRSLVREAIARHLGPSSSAPAAVAPPAPSARSLAPPGMGSDPVTIAVAQFNVPRTPGAVECVIEPTVTCNHCGHCLCYGH
jgi:hypothetical protein